MTSYKYKKQRLRQLVKHQEQQPIEKIQQGGHQFVDSDEFKLQEKHYKNYKHLETDYKDMLNLKDMERREVNRHEVYVLIEPEGAYLIKGFSGLREQYVVGFQTLNQYIFKPYRTNLDGTNGLYHQQTAQNSNQTNDLKDLHNQQLQKGQQIKIKHQNQKILEGVDPIDTQAKYYFNEKICMSNLGYQYNWPHRSYPTTKVSIPEIITQLTEKASLLYQSIRREPITYYGQAVIVNYYKSKDYMTGHLDDGEEDQVNPIFSFCFGLSCVFLIGHPTRTRKPYAVRLDAGDLLIMSGYSSNCYHGVPRIIQNSYSLQKSLIQQDNFQQIEYIHRQLQSMIVFKRQQLSEKGENINKRYLNNFNHVKNYFIEHRLNINVRQVWVRKNEEKTIKRTKEELKILEDDSGGLEDDGEQYTDESGGRQEDDGEYYMMGESCNKR